MGYEIVGGGGVEESIQSRWIMMFPAGSNIRPMSQGSTRGQKHILDPVSRLQLMFCILYLLLQKKALAYVHARPAQVSSQAPKQVTPEV